MKLTITAELPHATLGQAEDAALAALFKAGFTFVDVRQATDGPPRNPAAHHTRPLAREETR